MNTNNSNGYRRLHVWKESHDLVLLVYKYSNKFPREELFGLTSQIRRAAVSIPANIVEGYARSSKKEFLQFLYISQGSLSEVEYYLQLSLDLEFISEEVFKELEEKRRVAGNLLHGLIASLHRKS